MYYLCIILKWEPNGNRMGTKQEPDAIMRLRIELKKNESFIHSGPKEPKEG